MKAPIDTITRAQARKYGWNKYYTGKPCKHGHIAQRFTYNCMCEVCSGIEANKANLKRWHANHPKPQQPEKVKLLYVFVYEVEETKQ